jgi:hypothetical protein
MVANHNELLPIIAIHFLPLFFLKKTKNSKKQQKPKKYVIDVFASFSATFPKNFKKNRKRKKCS